MAKLPGAIQKPITAKGRNAMTWYNRVNLHVAVSETKSLHDYFNVKGRADSHFYVRKDGTVEQMVDTARQAYADLDGNDATISVETQGGLRNPNGEPWTEAQVDALARLFAWAVQTHGIPNRIATDSKVGPSSHGLSWHRLGIDGNFPALPSILAGRRQRGGGMHYSESAGKVCPGDAKIRQIPEIWQRAQQYIERRGGAPAPTENEDDMPKLTDQIPLHGSAEQSLGRDEISYSGAVSYSAAGGWEAMRRLPRIEATLKAQSAAIEALAKNVGVDPKVIERTVSTAVEKSLAGIEITLSVED